MEQKDTNTEEKKKINFLHSLRGTISNTVSIAVVLDIVIVLLLVVPGFSAAISNQAKNNMLNVAEAYANVMDNALAHEDGSDTLYEELLGNVTLEGVGSAYIYMTATSYIIRRRTRSEHRRRAV